MRPAVAAALAAVVALAGCAGLGPSGPAGQPMAGPAGEEPATPTTTTREPAMPGEPAGDGRSGPDLGIEVMGGELSFDPNRTYARVQAMLGTNVSPPGAVMVVPGMDAAGEASSTGRVYLDSTDEAVLAHEFAHSILLRAHPRPAVGSADAEFAVEGLVEGAAEYVEAAYTRRHLDRRPRVFAGLPDDPGRAYFLARYYYGYRYVDARADSPADVPGLHAPAPNTSEQVMHGLAPTAEPPRPLSVRVADRHLAGNATWRYAGADRLGELTAMLTLRTRLDAGRAREAAAGWGNDRLVSFSGDGATGFVWVLRWDGPAEADEFDRAARAYRAAGPRAGPAPTDDRRTPDRAFTDRVWGPTDAAVAVRRVSPETVAVVVGPEAFVEAVSVSGGNASVTVSIG